PGRTRYVMGDACADAGSAAFQSSRPVSMSNARRSWSMAPAMNTRLVLVTSGPPSDGEPQDGGADTWTKSDMVPSGTCQRMPPVFRSTAARVPHGGGLHGIP